MKNYNTLVIIIIPCRNERLLIYDVCTSLGFCSQKYPMDIDIHLLLVDNDSTDTTWQVFQEIQKDSPKKAVTLGFESQKGVIAARIKGIQLATQIANKRKIPYANVIILQADADVIYSTEYIQEMIKPFESNKVSILVEGCLHYSKDFKEKYNDYVRLCESVDDSFFKNNKYLNDEVIVTDAISAFRLSDYYEWGGFQREFDSENEEILAETTKLFIKAKLKGASKVKMENACAEHSYRKIIENPDVDFVTSGFPRSAKWVKRWSKFYKGPIDLKYFNINDLQKLKSLDLLINIRKQHLSALFVHLPKFILYMNNEVKSNKPRTIQNNIFNTEIPSKEYLKLYPGKSLEMILKEYVSPQ